MLREHDKNREPISIHALREEGDVPGQHTGNSRTEFLSTPSARRATWSGRGRSFSSYISIHALREEGDKRIWTRRAESRKFLSTPSARRATSKTSSVSGPWIFLSTPSARRATR